MSKNASSFLLHFSLCYYQIAVIANQIQNKISMTITTATKLKHLPIGLLVAPLSVDTQTAGPCTSGWLSYKSMKKISLINHWHLPRTAQASNTLT